MNTDFNKNAAVNNMQKKKGGGTERPYFCVINERDFGVQNNCVHYL